MSERSRCDALASLDIPHRDSLESRGTSSGGVIVSNNPITFERSFVCF